MPSIFTINSSTATSNGKSNRTSPSCSPWMSSPFLSVLTSFSSISPLIYFSSEYKRKNKSRKNGNSNSSPSGAGDIDNAQRESKISLLLSNLLYSRPLYPSDTLQKLVPNAFESESHRQNDNDFLSLLRPCLSSYLMIFPLVLTRLFLFVYSSFIIQCFILLFNGEILFISDKENLNVSNKLSPLSAFPFPLSLLPFSYSFTSSLLSTPIHFGFSLLILYALNQLLIRFVDQLCIMTEWKCAFNVQFSMKLKGFMKLFRVKNLYQNEPENNDDDEKDSDNDSDSTKLDIKGKLSNIIQDDTENIYEFVCSLPNVIISPFEVFYTLWIIYYYYLGVAVLSVVILYIIMIPVIEWMGRGFDHSVDNILLYKDKRINKLNEMMDSDGITITKIFGIFGLMGRRIERIRKTELHYLRKFNYSWHYFEVIIISMTSISTAVLFTTYSLIQSYFSSSSTSSVSSFSSSLFPSILLLDSLTWTLIDFPHAFNEYKVAKSSYKRWKEWIGREERGEENGGNERKYEEYKLNNSYDIIILSSVWGYSDLPSPSSKINENADEITPLLSSPPHPTLSRSFSPSPTPLPSFRLHLPDIRISKGSLTIVIGEVGKGKSSFLLSLLKELIFIEQNKSSLSSSSLISLLSPVYYCPQSSFFLHSSVKQNIILNLPFISSLYHEVLSRCDMKSDIKEWKDGDDTVIGEDGLRLSGGQRQRLALCRLMYRGLSVGVTDRWDERNENKNNNNKIFLLDDIFSALDPQLSNRIFSQCISSSPSSLLSQYTRVIVSHRRKLISHCDNVIEMGGEGNKGQVLFWGKVGEWKEWKKSRTLKGGNVDHDEDVFSDNDDKKEVDPDSQHDIHNNQNKNADHIQENNKGEKDSKEEEDSIQKDEEEKEENEDEEKEGDKVAVEEEDDDNEEDDETIDDQLNPRRSQFASFLFLIESVISNVTNQNPNGKDKDNNNNNNNNNNLFYINRMFSHLLTPSTGLFLIGIIIVSSLAVKIFSVMAMFILSIISSLSDDDSNNNNNNNNNLPKIDGSSESATQYVYLYVLFCLLQSFFSLFRQLSIAQCSIISSSFLHSSLFSSLLSSPLSFFFTHSKGSILSRFSSDIHRIDLDLPETLGDIGGVVLDCMGSFGLLSAGILMMIIGNRGVGGIDHNDNAYVVTIFGIHLHLNVIILIILSLIALFALMFFFISRLTSHFSSTQSRLRYMETARNSDVSAFITECCNVNGIQWIRHESQNNKYNNNNNNPKLNVYCITDSTLLGSIQEHYVTLLHHHCHVIMMNRAVMQWLNIRLDFISMMTILGITLILIINSFYFSSSSPSSPSSPSPSRSNSNLGGGLIGLIFSLLPSLSSDLKHLIHLQPRYVGDMNSVGRVMEYCEEKSEEREREEEENGVREGEGIEIISGDGGNNDKNKNNQTDSMSFSPPSLLPPALELRHLSFRYSPSLPFVLHDINLTIYHGEKIGIVGKSGQGKSSLMLMLLRLLSVEWAGSGEDEENCDGNGEKCGPPRFNIYGHSSLSSLSLSSHRSFFSYIPQHPHLFTGSLPFNLLLEDHEEAKGKIKFRSSSSHRRHNHTNISKNGGNHISEILSSLEIEKFVGHQNENKKNKNITQNEKCDSDTQHHHHHDDSEPLDITDNGSNFSVGQRQLLCAARAFIHLDRVPFISFQNAHESVSDGIGKSSQTSSIGNKILLIDEATANIDEMNDRKIQKQIKEISKGKGKGNGHTVLTIAHRLSSVLDCDRIIVIDKGRVREFDTIENLMKIQDGLFRKMMMEWKKKH